MKNKSQFDTFIDEKYLPLDIKIKAGLAILLLLLPLLGAYFLMYQPTSEEITRVETQISKTEQDLRKAEQIIRNRHKYEKELADTQAEFAEKAIILPKSQEIPNLLRNISDLGKTAGLDFLSFKPGAETPQEFYATIPINIETQGPYHNMGFFLDQVSKMERLVTVDNITMGSPKKEDNEMLLSSKCQLLTYRFTNKPLQQPGQNKK
ncbi:type IV pilus inner membrane component PilO [Desulfogranum japonicum]|uniref:type 4a pilus biogenesis protein PilO n=1 Tax=Desulfogranum japonicum TaxID=231447 RepID=UPI0004239015|nr:type 4a pilus biogenesis protein PilO [Desulfogranum japonicum]